MAAGIELQTGIKYLTPILKSGILRHGEFSFLCFHIHNTLSLFSALPPFLDSPSEGGRFFMKNECYLIDNMKFMPWVPDKFYDLAIVDPPYREKNKPTKWMKKISNMKKFGSMPDEKYFIELNRISKNQIIFGANNFNIKYEGFLIWDKGIRGSKRYSWVEIAALSKNLATVGIIIKVLSDAIKIHPTQKPVALYKWLLKNYAKPGWKIFDSHVGSGSIRIACHDMDFYFEGCEIDPDYWKDQEARFQNHIAGGELWEKEEIQELIYEEKELIT